ncbi:acetolactate synthase 2 small subunit [Oceanimonas baumannii]|uniref:Acetolactate synthase 2 small subunit n=1 Tax=Oceanimonas baumannii TaxID=129578 RepID=A0A235CI70_9GAMM|nr:acetolactate synthase 2 small subunit [Oceanimonas baumannii]OYD24223.1 acetolactate synthase 2 small subunit [Oceanimonas baumannii]TDW58949.1 acetolactate synthase small subunit [Oceanimonas baumannii]
MNQHNVQIEAQFRPEVLERVLRMTRHRGFRVDDMEMSTSSDCQNLNIRVTVSSERPIQLLSNQLEKLMNVTRVEAQIMEQPLKKSA